jgi:methenyltetrahydromethanopterin cyclohydrolase
MLLSSKSALKKIVEQAPLKKSKTMVNLFCRFSVKPTRTYKIDHNLFAPAVLIINNAKTGRVFKAGGINPKVLAESLGF